jgi:hypothetical protein
MKRLTLDNWLQHRAFPAKRTNVGGTRSPSIPARRNCRGRPKAPLLSGHSQPVSDALRPHLNRYAPGKCWLRPPVPDALLPAARPSLDGAQKPWPSLSLRGTATLRQHNPATHREHNSQGTDESGLLEAVLTAMEANPIAGSRPKALLSCQHKGSPYPQLQLHASPCRVRFLRSIPIGYPLAKQHRDWASAPAPCSGTGQSLGFLMRASISGAGPTATARWSGTGRAALRP